MFAHPCHSSVILSGQQVRQAQCPLVGESIHTVCTLTMGFYSAVKVREVLTYATTCANLENIDTMPSEISQSQKTNM